MKQVSVAEARNHLPALIHSTERTPVEILRRGKAVAVLVSRTTFDHFQRPETADSWQALQRFRATHDLAALDLEGVLARTRDRRPSRAAKW